MSVGNKIGAGALAALIAVVCGWFYAAPYITLYQLKKAIEAQDANEISRHIDLPALRESIKSGLVEKQAAGKSNLLRSLGAVADPMFEALVTPEGIAAMMKGEGLLGKKSGKGQGSKQSGKDVPRYSMGHDRFNRFVVRLEDKDKEDPKGQTAFIFTRDGLSWKLSAVRLPS